MPIFSSINSSGLNGLSVYKILVFTENSYNRLVKERGSTYVLDLFLEVCREKECRFMGLKAEEGYVYAILGFDFNENGKRYCKNYGRCCSLNK